MKKLFLWALLLGSLFKAIFLSAETKTASMQVTAVVPASAQVAVMSPLFLRGLLNGGTPALSSISIRSGTALNYAIRAEGGWITSGQGIVSPGRRYYNSYEEGQIFQVFSDRNSDRILTVTVEY